MRVSVSLCQLCSSPTKNKCTDSVSAVLQSAKAIHSFSAITPQTKKPWSRCWSVSGWGYRLCGTKFKRMFIWVVYDAYDNAEARNWESNQNARGYLMLSSSFLWSLLQSKYTAVTVSVAQVYIFYLCICLFILKDWESTFALSCTGRKMFNKCLTLGDEIICKL